MMAIRSTSYPAEHKDSASSGLGAGSEGHAGRPNRHQKVALVCDWLTTPGGAEKVLLELHRMYPDAPIYTSQYRAKKIDWFNDATVKTDWLNLFPACLRKFLGPLRQLYFSHLDLTSYDFVISVTGAEAKSVKTRKKPRKNRTCTRCTSSSAYHLCYCHVPTQYYWQMYDKYLKNPGFGVLDPLARLGIKLLVKPLRKADYRSARRPDQFVTISHYAADQIRQYYDRAAEVVAPPVEVGKFAQVHHRPKLSTDFSTGYYVISCRQAPWKRVDLAIQACMELKKPLYVIGDGAEHKNLVKLAKKSPYIKFIPWLSSDKLAAYLEYASGYIFPSMEPFGIAAVEALAAGCPVVAYAEGGSRDFVQPGKNGVLFPEQTVESLVKALKEFEAEKFNRAIVKQTAQAFRAKNFQNGIRHLVAVARTEHHSKLKPQRAFQSKKNAESHKSEPISDAKTTDTDQSA